MPNPTTFATLRVVGRLHALRVPIRGSGSSICSPGRAPEPGSIFWERRLIATVETVRGTVDLESLGVTLMHEHVFILDPEALQNYGSAFGAPYWDEDVRVEDAIGKLSAVRDAGIGTIVDPTVVGLGRCIPRIQRVNAEVDLNIVVATGIYSFLELPQFYRYRSVDQLADLFVRDIREGIDDTGVRAAFLKCAVEEYGLVGDVPTVVAAIAAASIETGSPIMVHTNAAAKTGLLALEAFVREGIDPTRVIVAHAGDSNDLEYLRAIADQGAILGCDRFGIEHFNPMEDRMRTLLALLEEGYADRIVLSHDAACFYDFFIGDDKFAGEKPDYLLVSRTVLPALAEAGVTQEQIDTMLIANPARFFSQQG
jgi:phosphotriesterase-related protein